MVDGAVETLQIDARAGNEVRRLSGGNQQKVTIARWVARGVHVMLCFDPTRGIDIRTKNQIYVLLRDLAEAGAAVLLYTSELKEVELVCDRAIVIFGGRIVRELTAEDADEPRCSRGVQPPRRFGPAGGHGGRGRERPRRRAETAEAAASAGAEPAADTAAPADAPNERDAQ
jgi:ribose transport system ATP-binding protein